MTVEQMGEHLYKKTILDDGSTRLQRLPKNYLEEKYNPPREELSSDIIRIEYHCCGCKANFVQNIPLQVGDANMTEVYLHFEKCGEGVDWRPIKRSQLES